MGALTSTAQPAGRLRAARTERALQCRVHRGVPRFHRKPARRVQPLQAGRHRAGAHMSERIPALAPAAAAAAGHGKVPCMYLLQPLMQLPPSLWSRPEAQLPRRMSLAWSRTAGGPPQPSLHRPKARRAGKWPAWWAGAQLLAPICAMRRPMSVRGAAGGKASARLHHIPEAPAFQGKTAGNRLGRSMQPPAAQSVSSCIAAHLPHLRCCGWQISGVVDNMAGCRQRNHQSSRSALQASAQATACKGACTSALHVEACFCGLANC